MRKTALIFTFLLLASACVTRNTDSTKRAALHLQMGTSYLTAGNYPAAMGELLKAEELDSSNPLIENNLGFAFYVRGKLPESEQHFRAAIRLKPNYTEARNNLGRILVDLGRFDEAIKELIIATNDLTYPMPEKSYAYLGLAYLKKTQYQLAASTLLKSLQIQSKSCTTLNNYGQSLFGLKKYVDAADAFDRAISNCKREKFDEPYYLSGLSYMRANQREQAVARLEELMQLYPQSEYHDKAQTLLEILK